MRATPAQSDPIAQSDLNMKSFADEVKSFFLGDDIFISYARGDSTGYALALANCLGEKEFICYLDQYGTGINDELDKRVIKKLKRSRVLVLIGSQRAIDSSAIRQEVELFKQTERAIIPIDIDGAFSSTELYRVIRGLPLADDRLPIATSSVPKASNAEPLDERQENLRQDSPSTEVVNQIVNNIEGLRNPKPSQRVLDRIKSTLKYTKRTQLQRRMLWLGSTFLLVSLGLAIIFLYVAIQARAAAVRASIDRDTATRDATAAREDSKQANEQATTAKDNALVALLSQIAADMNRAIAELQRRYAEDREKEALASAQQQERVARSLDQVTQAARLVDERPSDAMVISAAAFRSAPEAVGTHIGLLRSLQRYRHLKSILPSQPTVIDSVALALNGRLIASMSNNNPGESKVAFYDTKKKRHFEPKPIWKGATLVRLVCVPNGNLCAASTNTNIFVWRLSVRDDDIEAEPVGPSFEYAQHFADDGNSFVLTGDDRLVAHDRYSRKLLVWNLATPNNPPKTLDWRGYDLSPLAVSPDNKALVSGFAGGIVFWNLDNLSLPPVTVPFPEGTRTDDTKLKKLTFSSDGKFLAASLVLTGNSRLVNTSGTVVLIDFTKRTVLEALRDAGPEVTFVQQTVRDASVGVIFLGTQDLTLLVTNNGVSGIRTWEIMELPEFIIVREGESLDYNPGVYSLTTLRDKNRTLVIGGGDGALALWDMNREPLLDSIELAPRAGKGAHLLFDKSGTILLLHDSDDGSRSFFELSDGRLTEISTSSNNNGVTFAQFSPWVFAESERGVFVVDPMKPDAEPQKVPIPGKGVKAAVINATASMLAVVKKLQGNNDTRMHGVVLWDFRNRNKPKQLRTIEYTEDATCAAFSRDARLLAVGYRSGRIILWDIASAKKLRELSSLATVTASRDKDASVISLAFSPDGKTVASSSAYSPLNLWDTTSATLIGALEQHTYLGNEAYSLVFSPSGKKLIASSLIRLKVWNTDPSSWANQALDIANGLERR